MRDGAFMTRVLYGVIVFCVLISGMLATIVVHPQETKAAGNMADLQCLPVWFYGFPCGQPYPPPPQTPYTIGGQGCKCMDVTNGFPTPGTCVGPLTCKASAPSGMPMLPMLPMPMPSMPMPDMPMPPQDPCFSGFGAVNTGTTSTSTKPT